MVAQVQQEQIPARRGTNWWAIGFLVLFLVSLLVCCCCGPLLLGSGWALSQANVPTPAPTATPTVRAVEPTPTAMPTAKPISTPTAVPPTPKPAPTQTPVPPTPTVKVTTAEAGCGVPLNAVKLEKGKVVIPSWGYGPWGIQGVVYTKINPGATVPKGCSQLVTNFDGRNWVSSGEWQYRLSANEIFVVIQGDGPGEVEWKGDLLILRTNKAITDRAPASLDNAKKPAEGSSGISIVIYVR